MVPMALPLPVHQEVLRLVTLALLSQELEPPPVLLGPLLLVPLALLLQVSRERPQEAPLVQQAPPSRVSLVSPLAETEELLLPGMVALLPVQVAQTEELQFPGLAPLDLRPKLEPLAAAPSQMHRPGKRGSHAQFRGLRRRSYKRRKQLFPMFRLRKLMRLLLRILTAESVWGARGLSVAKSFEHYFDIVFWMHN